MNIVQLPGMGGVSGSPRYWVAGRLAGGWLWGLAWGLALMRPDR